MTEGEMVEWYHWLNGHEFEQGLGDGDLLDKPGMLQSTGSQRVKHNWATKLNWSTDKMHWSYLFGSIIANNYTHVSSEHPNKDTERFHHS